MSDISKEDLKKEIQEILKDADLDNTSAKKVRAFNSILSIPFCYWVPAVTNLWVLSMDLFLSEPFIFKVRCSINKGNFQHFSFYQKNNESLFF